MVKDLKIFLWILKLGAIVNLYFFLETLIPPLAFADANVLIPAQILFTVSAFRCLFPVRYTNNIVFHKSPISSIFLTRLLATFSEVALIYQIAYLLRLLNQNHVQWVDLLSWLMVVQVLFSQCLVWGAIITGRLMLYFYEEIGWFIIYSINTIVSVYLFITIDNFVGRELLIQLNLLFGVLYLPWQLIHLRSLLLDANKESRNLGLQVGINWSTLIRGLDQSIHIKNKTTQFKAWGGLVGISWMTAYWASVIPVWVYLILREI